MTLGLPNSCQRCGKPNSVRAGRKFCSLECSGNARARAENMPCRQCGTDFSPKRAESKFCSRDCVARFRQNRESLTCVQCGTSFEMPKSAAAKGGRFCSRTCRDAVGWRHGTLYGYGQGCRCDECSARARSKAQGEREAAKRGPRPSHIPHGTASSYGRWGCRCALCTETHREAARLDYARDPERASERSKRHHMAANNKTREKAFNSRKEWTGPELELVVTRTDLSMAELGAMLGRSYAAVNAARTRATKDPRWIKAAGVQKP